MLRLHNVRQIQYPSNGDHSRILTNVSTPENFTLVTTIKLVNLGDKGFSEWWDKLLKKDKSRYNTYFRLQYDFDNDYDPGHDWYGLFWSLEYEKLGLLNVYPIVRYFQQGQGPARFNQLNRVSLSPKENTPYTIVLYVRGQYAKAVIYEKSGVCLVKLAEVENTFERKRSLLKNYPLSIEITGESHLEVSSFELYYVDIAR